MNADVFFQMQAMPEYVAAAAMVALGLWLIRLNAADEANLAFAAFLLSRAFSMYTFTFQNLVEADPSPPATDVLLWERLRPVFTIATVFALALFVLVFPRPRGRLGRSGLARWCLLGAFVVCELSYAFRPSLWATYQVVQDPLAGEELRFESVGPFFGFQLLRILSVGLVPLIFARDYLRGVPGGGRSSLLIFFAAFALHAVFDGTDALRFLATITFHQAGTWTYLQILTEALGLLPVSIGVMLLAARALRTRELSERQDLRKVLAAVPFPAISNAVVFLLVASGLDEANGAWSLFFLGFWRLSLPLLATYALVKHSLFGIDVKVKRTLQRTVIAVVFVLVFFAVSEGAEALVVGRGVGPVLGILTTALLAFMMLPLQRFAERIADAAMPDVRTVSELGRGERRALYGSLVRSAVESGGITVDERRLLAIARERLGLQASEIDAIHREAGAAGLEQEPSLPPNQPEGRTLADR